MELAQLIRAFKYIDDTTLFEAVPMSRATRHFLDGPHERGVGGSRCGECAWGP